MSLASIKAELKIVATLSKTDSLIQSGLSAPLNINESFNLTDGIALGQVDRLYYARLTLSGTTPTNLDLTALTDAFGAAVLLAKARILYFKALAANTQTVNIGNGTNPFIGPFGAAGASIVSLEAGARRYFDNPAGWAVTPSTGMILKLVGAGAGTHLVDIVILGTSA
jgi:hypothetical protein